MRAADAASLISFVLGMVFLSIAFGPIVGVGVTALVHFHKSTDRG